MVTKLSDLCGFIEIYCSKCMLQTSFDNNIIRAICKHMGLKLKCLHFEKNMVSPAEQRSKLEHEGRIVIK